MSRPVQSTPEVILPLRHLALLSLVLPAAAQAPSSLGSPAQQAVPASPGPRPTLNHTVVFLDPAHGGDDSGARISTRAGEQLLEKDVTLALANRLRFQLTSLGLTVLSTREADQPAPAASGAPAIPSTLTTDARAGLANHVHPFACIVLHATSAGAPGIHLITSALPPPPPVDESAIAPIPWDSAQAAFLPQSQRLASELASALTHAGLAVHASRASIRPLDNLTCPAILIELAPLPSASVADSGYQARVAQTIATALIFWRGHAEPDLPPADPSQPGTSQP